MQRDDGQVQSERTSQEASSRRPMQEGRRSSGPPLSPWTDLEIRSFLQKWEVVEQEIGHQGKKMEEKAGLVCERLYEMGLNKSRESCLDLMWTLKHLHETLINERPKTEPLFSPYAEALYRILGPKCQGGYVPGVVYDWSGYPLPSMSPQPPMVMPSPVYQPWDYGMSASSAQLHGNPSLLSSQDSLLPRWEAWNAAYPLRVPHELPASLPGHANLQMPRPTSHDGSSSQ
ncbi:uncharacterized protein LOC116084634 isoform X2 [Mastomys coucha]|uniref:uncharacterized protein LOC116084634 isoform X2 n=1 Tax=Mastomys coucha TaxID=35658 RepID=UPI00126238BB|nr:uncharacterized protein LOC116084634 isoform X2 [Mastomys coucha]